MADSKGFLSDQSYSAAMARSVDELIAENSKPDPNLFLFLEVFSNLIHSRVDAPLEIIWCYCYVNFRCSNLDHGDLLQRSTGAKELFLQISRCSVSCKPNKSVVLLTPLLFQLIYLVEDLSSEKTGLKLWRNACQRTMSLISQIISYVSTCWSKESEEGEHASESSVSFDDLVNLWRYSRRTELTRHLTFVGVEKKACFGYNLDNLAGNLIAELFLLKLYSALLLGNKTEKELRSWSVSSINSFQNILFFDSIMTKLLESPIHKLGSEGEHVLKTILYDAVILEDYRFLTSDRVKRLAESKSKEILLKRILIVCEAFTYFRSRGDHKREYSYINSLSSSKFYLQMVKQCVAGVAIKEEMEKLKGLSSVSLLKWLVEFEEEGVKLFDETELVKKAKMVVKDLGMDSKAEKIGSDSELFYIDNKGSEENGAFVEDDQMKGSLSAAFVAAAHSMSGKRRKGEANDDVNKKLKFDEEEDSDSSFTLDGSLSGESELDNPSSDDD